MKTNAFAEAGKTNPIKPNFTPIASTPTSTFAVGGRLGIRLVFSLDTVLQKP